MLRRYWLDQVLEPARLRHDQWLQSSPDRRALLKPAYILGDRKLIPEAANAVESVLRIESLDAIPKPMAEACRMRHRFCTAELIIWFIMKQLILPPDVNEVTMRKEILTPPRSLNSRPGIQVARRNAAQTECSSSNSGCIKFVIETMSGIIQYCRTIGNIWVQIPGTLSLCHASSSRLRHRSRSSYSMPSEFLIELKLNEEQEKITQIATGSNNAQMKLSAYDEYVNANKGKVQQRVKGKEETGKVESRTGDSLVMMTGSLMVANMVTIVQSIIPDDNQDDVHFVDPLDITLPSVQGQSSPKPRTASMTRTLLGRQRQNGTNQHGRVKNTKLLKASKAKARDISRRESLRERVLRDLLLQDRLSPRLLEQTAQPKSRPEARLCAADGFLFAMMSTKSKPTWRHATWNSADYCRTFSSLANGQLHLEVKLLYMVMMPRA